jgi:hypothetical protein
VRRQVSGKRLFHGRGLLFKPRDQSALRPAAEAIEHGLDHLRDGGRIAILADLNFLSAHRRYALYTHHSSRFSY